MVATDVKLNERRIWWERLIWVIDMGSYLFLGIAGWGVAFQPSGYVLTTLDGITWIVWLWASILFLGGLVAFIGRLTKVWAVEIVANVLAAWGAVLYVVILIPALASGGSVPLAAIVLIAWGAMARRYAELIIFTNEPREQLTWSDRLMRALRRRTKYTVPREHF